MSSKRYLVLQGRITRSWHYDDISTKSLTQRQFRDAFSNKSGDIAIQFDGIMTWLTVPWRDFIIDRVKSMEHDLMSANIPDEQEHVEESEWVRHMQELRLDYNN